MKMVVKVSLNFAYTLDWLYTLNMSLRSVRFYKIENHENSFNEFSSVDTQCPDNFHVNNAADRLVFIRFKAYMWLLTTHWPCFPYKIEEQTFYFDKQNLIEWEEVIINFICDHCFRILWLLFISSYTSKLRRYW